jgi:hypothetical protein
MIKPKRSKVGTWKVNESKVQGRFVKPKPTFDQLLNKYENRKAILRDRPLKKRPRSPSRQDRPSSSRGESYKRRGDVTTLFPPQEVYATMPWAPSPSDSSYPTWAHEGICMQCYPVPYPPFRQGEEDHRRSVLERLARSAHDRLGSRQSGQEQQPATVRLVPNWSDRSYQGQGHSPFPR